MSAPLGYRVTALGRAVTCLWRAASVVVPAIVANAALQALLLVPGTLPGANALFIVIAIASLLVLVASFTVVAAALLAAIDGTLHGTEGVGAVLRRARRRFGPVLVWALMILIATIIGLSLYVIPGLIVLAAVPFLLLAVVDARRSPLKINFATIAARWARWLLTLVIMGMLCAVLWLLATAAGFFIAGPLGSAIAWLILGAIASWFTAAWALIYRSAQAPTVTSADALTVGTAR